MKRKVLSHQLPFGAKLDPTIHRDNINASRRLGYSGMVFIPALIDTGYTPDDFLAVHRDLNEEGIICGFLPRKGPDPLADDEHLFALESLRRPARFAVALRDAGLGPNYMIGPMHTHHSKKRVNWDSSKFARWMDDCETLSQEFGIRLAFEPLRPEEDATLDPFRTILGVAKARKNSFAVHWDDGHAHEYKLGPTAFEHYLKAGVIAHHEYTNRGRNPLDIPLGIDSPGYA